tara:strand:- start:243385 stop:243507 length:123 start_codon:yes stop_codon:yes gene_type:complete
MSFRKTLENAASVTNQNLCAIIQAETSVRLIHQKQIPQFA